MEDNAKKFRSPQFPFISLEKAISRAREFENEYHTHAARVINAVKVWGYAEKSSGGIQTIAALSAYGLMDDEGKLDSRKLILTPLAMTILKDVRPGPVKDALKRAALRPRVIAELWTEWGNKRPPDQECISILHLEKQFSEEAAKRLLTIYDDTIRYAKLADSDTKSDNIVDTKDADGDTDGDKFSEIPPPPPLPKQIKVQLMDNERVVFAHELRPNQSFRIIVAGEVDMEMVNALKAFAEFQEKLVGKTPATTQPSIGPK